MNYDTLPNNVYYDANIINSDSTGAREPPHLVFSDIRDSAVLTNPSQYELSITRFTLQTGNSLPLWIPSIKLNQEDFNPNLTIYSFHLVYNFNGLEYSSEEVFVQYIPCDLSQIPPINIKTTQDMHVPYYYIKSFNTVSEMFNNSLSQAYQQLQQNALYYGVVLPSTNAPFFEWNSESSKFILNADVIGYDNNEFEHISIYCNTPMYSLMSGFQGDYYGIRSENGKNYKFKIKKEMRSLNLFTVTDNYSVIQLYQEYSSASLFTPISSIVFTSSTLPVLPSHSTKPTIFNGDLSSLTNSGNNNNITSMLTDFQSSGDSAYPFSGALSYIPSGEYRMISMNNGSDKINSIDLSVYWKDQYSHLHPFYLAPGCKADIKILFRKIKISN